MHEAESAQLNKLIYWLLAVDLLLVKESGIKCRWRAVSACHDMQGLMH
jgi:hypothetical protein